MEREHLQVLGIRAWTDLGATALLTTTTRLTWAEKKKVIAQTLLKHLLWIEYGQERVGEGEAQTEFANLSENVSVPKGNT